MPEALREREDLREVQRQIAEGEQLVVEQKARIERLISQDQDTASAKQLLQMLQAALMQWYEHQQAIAASNARHTSSEP